MRKDLEDRLYNEFPQLYRDRCRGSHETRMCDGCCVGDGWFQIIYDLSTKIHNFCLKYNLTGNNYICAFQVKEKFGGLRFYLGNYHGNNYTDLVPLNEEQNDELFKYIQDAENCSLETCDVCGSHGKQYEYKGFISTRCEVHKDKNAKEFHFG